MVILLLDSINKNTLAIARHLGRSKQYTIHVAYHTFFSITNYSKYISKKHKLCSPKDKAAFQLKLIQLLKTEKFDLVIPVGFSSYTACADIQEEIRKYADIIITSSQNIDIAASKAQTYQLAERINVPCPKTIYISDRAAVHHLELEYPIVLKGPFEAGKNIVTYVYNKEDLIREFYAMIEKNNFTEPHLPLIQEFIRGDGYGFFAYYEQGLCKRVFMHQRIREYPAKGGASVCAQSFSDPLLMEYGKRILDHLKWNGVAMVEFKKDVDGIYKLMEINPKFWGSLDLALCAGVNFPQYLIDQHNRQEVTYSEKFKDIRFQWILNGELFHFFQRPSSLLKIIKDFRSSENDIWLKDLNPNIFQLFYILAFYYKKWRG
jgi:predicted ATP-grasp superfamily ATP-dependent carboligase